MAHFAKLDSNNKVIHVSVVANANILDADGNESEEVGIQYLTQVHNHSNWKQTSYNRKFRKNYAGKGYTYDESRDAFIPPRSYPSWVLNEESCSWEAPIPYPSDGKFYMWDENSRTWVLQPEV